MASAILFVVITTDIGRYFRQDLAGEGGQGRHGRTRTPANAQPIIFTFLQEAASCLRDSKTLPTPGVLSHHHAVSAHRALRPSSCSSRRTASAEAGRERNGGPR